MWPRSSKLLHQKLSKSHGLDRPKHVSTLLIAGLTVQSFGLVLFTAGFAGAEWSSISYTQPILRLTINAHVGLWESCNNLNGCTSKNQPAWQIQAAGLQIAAFVLYLTTTGAVLLYYFVLKPPWVARLRVLFTVTGSLTGILIFAGCIIWEENRNKAHPGTGMKLDWAFFVAILGGVLQAIAAAIYCADNVLDLK